MYFNMGLLRFLLAVSVIIAHVGTIFGFTMIGGKIAVQTFFIISGFYMSLILNEKYIGRKNYFIYLRNRFLRIYPTYLLVLILTFLFSIFWLYKGLYSPLSIFVADFKFLNPFTFWYLVIENIAVIGQDIGMFLEISKNGTLYFLPSLSEPRPFVYNHLLIPQAWTLSIEFMFYILAPLFVKRKAKIIFGIILLSLLLRFYLNSIGLHHEPWINKFFPTELVFFMFGILSYKIYLLIKKIKINQKIFVPIYIILILLTLFYDKLPRILNSSLNPLQWIYFIFVMILIPFIFIFFENKFDKLLGELSYPMYISHVFVYSVVLNIKNVPIIFKGISAILLTVIFSYLLLKLFINKIERFRKVKIKTALKN